MSSQYSADQFLTDINVYHTEIGFRYKGVKYFVSDNFWRDGKSPGVLISGPDNDEFVPTAEDALDKLLVDGKPLRDMLGVIDLNAF